MSSPRSKRVRFAEASASEAPQEPRQQLYGKTTVDADYDSDENNELEADITSSRRNRRRVNVDGYGSDASDQDEVAASSDNSDEEPEEKNDMFDSDEQANRKRHLDIDDIEGQEMTSTTRTEPAHDSFDRKGKRSEQSEDGGEERVKIEAFNMKEDLEEGSFDASGTFVWNKKDPQAHQDEWLNDVSKEAIQRARESKSRQELKQTAHTNELAQRWDSLTNNDLIVAIIEMLQPHETVFTALARLGNRGAKAKKVSRWSKKGRQLATDQKELQRRKDIEQLTELADQALARGISSVYDDTFEQMVRRMRIAGRIPDDWVPGTPLPAAAQSPPLSADPLGDLLD
ncbi:hypothetical protein EV183_005073 [Coemansia sp. RSA 2336]|nr:hypothetical protein EV183_005073 [Coemansia sp. RSA 2336]